MFPSVESLILDDIAASERLHGQLNNLAPALARAATLCAAALKNGGKLVFFGNGGSAADSQHMAAEFVGRFEHERDPLPAIALTVNTSALTAIGNDYGFDQVFERQVRALAGKNDVIIAYSTSGNSKNVLLGVAAAKKIGAKTIGFSGQNGALKDAVDIALAVPSSQTPRIQEGHILLGHILTHATEALLQA